MIQGFKSIGYAIGDAQIAQTDANTFSQRWRYCVFFFGFTSTADSCHLFSTREKKSDVIFRTPKRNNSLQPESRNELEEMNGPLRMYPMREIVRHDAPPSSVPACMYSVRDLHSGSPARPDISEQNNTTLPGMAALEQKQERILKQLEELKQQMLSIRRDLKQSGLSVSPPANAACKTSAGVSSKATKKINIKDVPNIVIHSHPSHPPYSLLILKKLWANCLDLRVDTFVHSSLIKLPESTSKFVEELSREECSNGVPKVTLTLIWKDVSVNKLEFLVGLTPLVGECNLLRFLARSTSLLTYDESDHQMDSMLDLSYCIVCTPTKTKRAHLLQQVSNKLAKSPFLFGETICVADIAMYSAIKQVVGSKDVNVKVGKWMGRCEG